MIKHVILYTLLAATVAAYPGHNAFAQQGGVVLVTPDGDLLDYVPEAGEVSVVIDQRGRRLLVDHYGRVVAYEMPTDGGEFNGQPDRNRDRKKWSWDWEPGEVTGTVPGGRVDRDIPVTSQSLPPANGQSGEARESFDEAAIDPRRSEEPRIIEEIAPSGNGAAVTGTGLQPKLKPETVIALQVMLDREGYSPGVIDGKMGDNVRKALVAWEAANDGKLDTTNSETILQRLSLNGGLPFTTYEITPADAAGPYVAAIPDDYSQKAALPALSYTSTAEKLAEQFHMDEAYLRSLNPDVDFSVPGTIIKVVNPGVNRKGEVTRIVANKRVKQVQAFDKDGNMIAAYPATIGSSDTPSPSGTVTVERIALDPNYTYNPKINFQQGNNTKVLTIPPGPNGPVGNVWIALSKPTYGIHGTPEPSKIGKTASHGCVRLTNWDARELAKMVKPGVIVQFID